MTPFGLVRAFITFVTFGMSLWVKLLGPRRARSFVIGGMAVSTAVVVILELKGV